MNRVLMLLALLFPFSALAEATPPGPPTSGYGSTQGYITDSWKEYDLGGSRDGSRVWWYVPDVLKDGDNAPVVVYLHGWTAYLPAYYMAKIEHLLRQGIIVIYPQYQKSGVVGLFTDTDQTVFLDRAVSSTALALNELGGVANTDELYVSGHSLGGLLGFCWEYGGGVPARALVLENAALNSAAQPIPVDITILDWNLCAPEVTTPVYMLTGAEDALHIDSLQAYDMLVNSPTVETFLAHSDSYGNPDIVANHGAPLASSSVDTLDGRYYFAGLDAVMAGQTHLSFNLGNWSDGTPVIPVERAKP